jgi:histone deacetylase 1/2
LEKPTQKFWNEAKNVLRYLKGTFKYGMKIEGIRDKNNLKVFSDSDFAESHDRKSTSGCVVMLNDTVISWFSRKQSLTALSTTEAEIIAFGEAMRELLFWKQIIQEMGICLVESKILCDNQSAIKILKSEGMLGRTKHIGVIVGRMRDLIHEKELKVEYVPTEENVADMFTKPLSRIKYERNRECLVSQVDVEREYDVGNEP